VFRHRGPHRFFRRPFWYREWKKTADASYKRGNDALAKGHLLTARSNWLRAISYYQAGCVPRLPGTRIVRLRSTACANAPAIICATAPRAARWFRFHGRAAIRCKAIFFRRVGFYFSARHDLHG